MRTGIVKLASTSTLDCSTTRRSDPGAGTIRTVGDGGGKNIKYIGRNMPLQTSCAVVIAIGAE